MEKGLGNLPASSIEDILDIVSILARWSYYGLRDLDL